MMATAFSEELYRIGLVRSTSFWHLVAVPKGQSFAFHNEMVFEGPIPLLGARVMIDFDRETLPALTFLSGCRSEWKVFIQLLQAGKVVPPNPNTDVRAQYLRSLQTIGQSAEKLEMSGVARAANTAFEQSLKILSPQRRLGAFELQALVDNIHSVLLPFMNEMAETQLFTAASRHAHLYQATAPFGESVEYAFPSAMFDIAEAGKCMALARWTAAVMHLMRATEVGLNALSKHFEIEVGQNWNTALDQIEKSLKELRRRSHGAEQEQWASEAAIHFRLVKNAWRNHAMHAHIQYDEERAKSIYQCTADFLKQLSINLRE